MRHLRLFFAAFVAVLLCVSCSDGDGGGKEKLEGYNKLDAARFKAMIDSEIANGSNPQILDYRSAAKYAEGHIPGAINIDASDPKTWSSDNGEFMQKLTAEFETSKKIFIYGDGGWSSSGMALPGRIANTWGKPLTYNLESGFSGWQSAGYNVEK